MNTASTLLFACLGIAIHCSAQPVVQTHEYPQNFFRYPLDLSPSTAGTFAELRPNHFHSGLDFRTNGTTGYPVHAVNDGYVSRLRVQFGGFGNAVYIAHANGYTSVYGHLERFAPRLARLVRQEQQEKKRFDVDFDLQPFQEMVCQGDVVAWSGNTGGSAGPHLHFELRDSESQETINPQLFGLRLRDHIPPALGTVCIYSLGQEPFSENTPRRFFAVKGDAGHYRLARPLTIPVSGRTGFGITATDRNSTSLNRNGIYSIELMLDGRKVYTFAAERFAFDQTHAINAYIDYPTFLASHRFIQKSFILPGCKITLYPQAIDRGIIDFRDNAVHTLEYIVRDVAGNTSTLSLHLQSTAAAATAQSVPPAGILMPYNRTNEFSNDKLRLIIPAGNLYDDLQFRFAQLPERRGAFSAVYRVHNRFTPINDSVQLWVKPDSAIGRLADKAVIVSTGGLCAGGIYEDGYVKAQLREFGDYEVKVDTIPPYIRPLTIAPGSLLSGRQRIALRIGDALSGVKSFAGTIDGRWVLMEWDFKTRILSYTFDGTVGPGKHLFELTVTDNKDNTARYTANFYR